ncbi:dTDP-4-dehydrorhamnose 3,5-epimerase family protein [Tenacibaculum singaporense]|uniref:dTDP-4-dehydrorhamnose 3,5-epimerase family protein n=1 Tax=Tenacibaculum singaporense TaxID=2358479 RepID=UPI000F687E03|nr:dTDP-4-dehydrorhamnose 3,5-epimerase family protein [Tenacibaculum singaporense]RSC93564.1 sugar epimerase [Tenacibaculum singaporense]
MKPNLIKGGKYVDERGKLEFFNDFDMSPIKRLYFTTHFDTNVVRAWQGHTIESRWFYCVKGSFTVKLVKIDNWETPSDSLKVYEYKLIADKQQILHIPNGFANGFKALEGESKLMILSNYGFNEIENDQIRFDQNKWTQWEN